MLKSLILAILLPIALSKTYPAYKQCDGVWGYQQLGNSTRTICQDGAMMTSAAMALKGTDHDYNPSTLNKWLKDNKGYTGQDLIPHKLNILGLNWQGMAPSREVKQRLDQGKIVLCNVHNGRHWVLATGYNGDNILVNDPYYSTTSYAISEVGVDNSHVWGVRTAVYNDFVAKLRSQSN